MLAEQLLLFLEVLERLGSPWGSVYLALFAAATAWTLYVSFLHLRRGSVAGWKLLAGPAALVLAGGLIAVVKLAQVRGLAESNPEFFVSNEYWLGVAISLSHVFAAGLLALPILLPPMAALAIRAVRERRELRVLRGVGVAATMLLIAVVLAKIQGVGAMPTFGLLRDTGVAGIIALFCALMLGISAAAGVGRDASRARARMALIMAAGLGAVLLAGTAVDAGVTARSCFPIEPAAPDQRAVRLLLISNINSKEAVAMARASAVGILGAGVLALILLFRSVPRPGRREALGALSVILLLVGSLAPALRVPNDIKSVHAESLGTDVSLWDIYYRRHLPPGHADAL